MSSSATHTTTAPTSVYLGFELSYGIDRARMSARLGERLLELELDDETRSFMERAVASRHGRALSFLHGLLRPFMSDFDVNGLLGTYPMFLLGSSGFRRVLGERGRGRLLDVGAGNGDVTALAAPLFDHVTTTETSGPMARRLRRRGFACEAIDLSREELADGPFDVVSLCNVLDRSAQPRSLLRRARALVRPGGCLLVATPLPYDAFSYEGGATRAPRERLEVSGRDWEQAAESLVRRELLPLGLELEHLARAPYISGGDAASSLYVLDDAISVCRAP